MRASVVLASLCVSCVVPAVGMSSWGTPPPLPPPPAYRVAGSASWSAAASAEVPRDNATDVAPATVSTEGRPPPLVVSGKALGLLQVGYARSQYPQLDALREGLQRARLFETAAKQVNRTIAIPRPIDVQLVDCGTVNAFYDPEGVRIIVCYELFGYLAQTFQPTTRSDDELANAVAGAAFFAFFHELGHALRHQLDLPLTGREEDAVDQLATLTLLDDENRGAEMALAGARWFLLKARAAETDRTLAFWDEHSFDEQRFYDIACLIYGSDPARHADIGKEIPSARRERCAEEYRTIKASWSRLLAPHLRTDGGGGEDVVARTIEPDRAAPAVADCAAVLEHMLTVYGKTRADVIALGGEAAWNELMQTCERESTATERECLMEAADAQAIQSCDDTETAIGRMSEAADRLCACADMTCAEGVMRELMAMQEPAGKPTKQQMERAIAIAERMAACQRALMTAASGSSP